jgi:hypothetical protein
MGKWRMKTTVELPDDLLRRIKLRALQEHKKLKQSIAELLERGLAEPRTRGRPKPLRLRGGILPSVKDIEAAISRGRD